MVKIQNTDLLSDIGFEINSITIIKFNNFINKTISFGFACFIDISLIVFNFENLSDNFGKFVIDNKILVDLIPTNHKGRYSRNQFLYSFDDSHIDHNFGFGHEDEI